VIVLTLQSIKVGKALENVSSHLKKLVFRKLGGWFLERLVSFDSDERKRFLAVAQRWIEICLAPLCYHPRNAATYPPNGKNNCKIKYKHRALP